MHFHFLALKYSDKAVQIQSMQTVRHFRPTCHKSAHKILIYGQILKLEFYVQKY